MFKHFSWVLLFGFFTANAQSLSQPEQDFETFWRTFRDHYAFFKLKGVNWDSTYARYRPLITPKTKEKELVAVLAQMVEPLRDGHVSISKKDELLYKGKNPKSYFKDEFRGNERALWQVSFETLQAKGFGNIQGAGPVVRDEPLYEYTRSAEVGYVKITRCFAEIKGITDDKHEADDLATMLRLFDEILGKMTDTKALIIDLRGNPGGHGGEELARRLATEKRLTHYKSVREGADYEHFGNETPFYVTPNEGIRYTKPVVILTSDRTASSAEDFTIALYRQPNVTVIGMNTSGMLSDMYEAQLSNKIEFTLSHQRYYTPERQLMEEVGVPAHIAVKNTKQDLETKQDPVILKALEKIG
ncbi:MAG: S41 family peptidase [Spirosomaceae bacterium]|nr:S41 family peptidase [Spirosomataceae bacterium]